MPKIAFMFIFCAAGGGGQNGGRVEGGWGLPVLRSRMTEYLYSQDLLNLD
jgi:hypothetical protein